MDKEYYDYLDTFSKSFYTAKNNIDKMLEMLDAYQCEPYPLSTEILRFAQKEKLNYIYRESILAIYALEDYAHTLTDKSIFKEIEWLCEKVFNTIRLYNETVEQLSKSQTFQNRSTFYKCIDQLESHRREFDELLSNLVGYKER